MKTWEKIMLYPIGLYIWLTDGIKKMSKKWKPAMAMLMAVVMLCGMFPTMVTAAGWSGITVLGFNYGDDGFLSITAPSTVGNYTYGTANGDTAAETAVNQSVLPESGWQWALKRESSNRYRLILNDFNITYSGNDDIMMSNTDLIIELRGSNSLVKTSSSASGSGIASNMGCTLSITGEGSLNVAGCSYAIYMHIGYTLTIESGNVNLGASYSTIYASKVELGEYVTAQSSLNSDGSNPSSFASGSRPGNYKWFQTVTNIPEYTLTFDANGGSGAMSGTTILATTRYVLPECTFIAPYNKAFKAWEVNGEEKYDGETITVTEDTTIKAIWMDKSLGVKVGNVKVTTDNAANITGDGIVSGTVSYDYKTRTLTLNNATIYASTSSNAIRSNADLTIKLIGENTLYGEKFNGEASESWQWVISIEEEGNLDIIGAGSLTVNGAAGAGHSSYSIYLYNGDLTVGGDCTVILNPSSSNRPRPLSSDSITIIADDSAIFVSKSLNDEPLEAYDPDDYYDIKYMKIVPKYDVEIGFDANGGSGTMNVAEAAAATEYTLPENGFTAPAGKQFKNWEVNGTAMNPGDKVFLIEDFTVKAIWEDISHTCSLEPVEKVWPDCENGGKEAYYKCEGCGKFFEDAAGTTEIANIANWGNLPKNGHDYGTLKAAQPEIHTATELKAGVAAHYFCDECDTYFTEGKVATTLDALTGAVPTHNYANVNGYKGEDGHADTCACGAKDTVVAHTPNIAAPTENDDQICSVCEYVIAPKLVHIHQNNLTKVPAQGADCENDGNIEYYTCTCGKRFADATASVEITDKDSVVIKGGHKYGTEWKSDADNHWNECACGEKVNAAAHKDENGDGKCDVCDYNVGLPTTPDGGNKPSDTPQTGDNNMLWIWLGLLCVSAMGIFAVTVFSKKKSVR